MGLSQVKKQPLSQPLSSLKTQYSTPQSQAQQPYLLKPRLIVIGVLSHQGLDGDKHGRDALGWAPGRASPRPAKHIRGNGGG